MSIENEDMPLLSIQEIRAKEAPRIYRPHTVAKPAPFDWAAITPTCTECGTRTGTVNLTTGLCSTCDPARPATPPKTAKARPTSTRTRVTFDTDAAIEAYEGGQLIAEIADALGVQTYRIRNILVYRGIPIRDDRHRRWSERPPRVPNPRNPIDETAMVADYLEGYSAPQLALTYGIAQKRVRDTVARHGHQLRDDRKTRSGGKPKEYDPQLVEQVRRLYLDEHLSQSAVAHRLGSTIKVVQSIMNRHQIPARQGETGHIDGSAGLRAEIAELGVPVYDIKTWAMAQGLLLEIAPGTPPRRVFEAYRDAHRQDGAA